MQLTRECDDIAARHWRQAASDRGQTYKEWLNHVEKAADFIDFIKNK